MTGRLLSAVFLAALFGATACGREAEEQQDTGIQTATPGGASLDTLPPGLIGSGTAVGPSAAVPVPADPTGGPTADPAVTPVTGSPSVTGAPGTAAGSAAGGDTLATGGS